MIARGWYAEKGNTGFSADLFAKHTWNTLAKMFILLIIVPDQFQFN